MNYILEVRAKDLAGREVTGVVIDKVNIEFTRTSHTPGQHVAQVASAVSERPQDIYLVLANAEPGVTDYVLHQVHPDDILQVIECRRVGTLRSRVPRAKKGGHDS
jgi:hypothetical protein